MNFRANVLPLIILLALTVTSCTSGSNPIDPTISLPTADSSITTSSTMQPGHNLLGFYWVTVDADAGTVDFLPVRAADLHLNVLQFLELGPCFDCFSIANFDRLPNDDVQLDVVLTHPFPNEKLSGFDVRGIAMFRGNLEFPSLGLTVPSITEGNPELINADGHTTLYRPETAGNGLSGYLKGKLAPASPEPNATLNGYKTYFTDENRRYFLAGDELSATYLISPPQPQFTFGYAVDASWAPPTDPVTVPDSFPTEANSLEAYKIETSLDGQLGADPGSTINLTIDVYDWQGGMTVDAATIECPGLWTGTVNGIVEISGPADKRFIAQVENDFGSTAGTYPLLIRVTDTESAPGEVIDYTAFRLIDIPVVAVNHDPVCSADVSTLEPDVDEVVTFTDTSTDPDGASDIVLSEWDWDNDGVYDESGAEVTHSWSEPGVYEVNHKVTDQGSSFDELDELLIIDVGLFISLQEDLDSKPVGRAYKYWALDSTYQAGAVIDVEDLDGPWDFTTIGLIDSSNRIAVIDRSNSEVSSFRNDFNLETAHFLKFDNIYDPLFPVLYQAEYHDFTNDELVIYGFHDPALIGSSPFGPPDTIDTLAIPYPLTVNTDYQFNINVPGFALNYTVKALGEGDVTVPYNGGTTFHCIMIMYRFSVSSAEPVNGGTLNFAFIADDGKVVANVIAVNDPPDYNWNNSTNTINSDGETLFQALNSFI